MTDFAKLIDDAVRDAVFAAASATSGRGDFDRLSTQAAASQAALLAALAAAQAEVQRLARENHNLNWALGTPGYAEMATPEEQAEHEAAVANIDALLSRIAERKRRFNALRVPPGDLLEHLERLTAECTALRVLLARLVQWGGADQSGAPDHGHDVPGVWDESGKPCADCAAWEAARAMVKGRAHPQLPCAPDTHVLVPREPTEAMIQAGANTPGVRAIDNAAALTQIRGMPLDSAAFADGAPLRQAWVAMVAAAQEKPHG